MNTLQDWVLTPFRAAVHRATRTAVIADPHLGYDLARRRRGDAIPCFGLAESLTGLRRLREQYDVQRLVIAGDLVEDASGLPMVHELLAALAESRIELAGIAPGNHDRQSLIAGLPWQPDGIMLGRWRVVHGDALLPPGYVVQGHVHPCLNVAGGRRAPCYLHTEQHLVLPAFSADAAGVNIMRQPRWRDYHCVVIVGEKVMSVK
ncbi:MAG: metallophosphoesterase [Gemmataceae bacterium]